MSSEDEDDQSSDDEGHSSLEDEGQPPPEVPQRFPPKGKGRQPARGNWQTFSCGLCPESFPSMETLAMVTLLRSS
jgi:hypothetical protein